MMRLRSTSMVIRKILIALIDCLQVARKQGMSTCMRQIPRTRNAMTIGAKKMLLSRQYVDQLKGSQWQSQVPRAFPKKRLSG